VEKQEKLLEQLTGKQHILETALADPTLYEASRKEQLKQLLADKSQLTQQLNQVEEAWLEACEALESAEEALNSEQA